MSIVNSLIFDEICNRGCIRDADVAQLREAYYADGQILENEAASLFEINDACRVQETTWAPFFIEAIADFIINDAEPQGYITKTNADWLINCVSRDGSVQTQTELELLLKVLDTARWSPECLVEFTLQQVKLAVCDGTGPLRAGTTLEAGTITDDDVDLLRRILYAFAGDGNIAITRKEAEILFDINDHIADGPQNPVFTELFIKAISSCVMAASGYSAPPREEMLRREAWLESRGELSLGNMLTNAFQGGFAGIFGIYQEQTAEQRALARLEQQRLEIITNQEITNSEASWLVERIDRDDQITPNEEALLLCIKEASPKIAPELEPLLDKVDQAA
ncbi:MAG: hypothetical protein AAGD43_10760 [Pseudomonadota bacterium]